MMQSEQHPLNDPIGDLRRVAQVVTSYGVLTIGGQ